MLSMNEIEKIGFEMHALITKLYPICRSITGNGVRETLKIVKGIIPIQVQEVATGTNVFDWIVPKEWNIIDAYINDSKGNRVIDFKDHNLHVLSYSMPVKKKLSYEELSKHIFTLPDSPDWIPYLTSYYNENWGFCLSQNQFKKFKDDTYEVVIDSEMREGSLSYGELLIRGELEDEFLLSCYVCHPSLCNDNLSGIALLTSLAKFLQNSKLRYSYRFLFVPETIGAIAWLSENEKIISRIKQGLVATCVGDRGKSTYKRSRKGKSEIDRAAEKALSDSGQPYEIIDFFPGSDERQFCSPGFDLPVGSLMRTPYGKFPQYHTSADDLDFVHPQYLGDSFKKYLDIVFIVENNKKYLSVISKGEPQLSKRGLSTAIGSMKNKDIVEAAIFWVLNLSDGDYSLLDISIRSGITFNNIKKAADILLDKKLISIYEGKSQ